MPDEKNTTQNQQSSQDSKNQQGSQSDTGNLLLSDTQKLAKSLYNEYKTANNTLAKLIETKPEDKTAEEQARQNLSLTYGKIKEEFNRTKIIYNTAFYGSSSNKKEIEAAEKDLLYLSDIVFEMEGIKKKSKQQTRPNSGFSFSDFYKAADNSGIGSSESKYDSNNKDNKHDLREQIQVREKEIRSLKKELEISKGESAKHLSELQKLQELQNIQELKSCNQNQTDINTEKKQCILELANAQKNISDAASAVDAAKASAHVRDKLINLALAHLGHTAPENPKSDAFYNTILNLYDFVKKSLLTRHCWKFALAECKLNPLAKQNANHITRDNCYSYELPEDLLNIQKIIPNCDYEIMGNTLLCRDENVRLNYIKCVDDSSMPEFFKTLMVYSITAASAALVTQNEAIARKWELEANNSFCTAIATDSSQQAIRSVIRNPIYMAHF